MPLTGTLLAARSADARGYAPPITSERIRKVSQTLAPLDSLVLHLCNEVTNIADHTGTRILSTSTPVPEPSLVCSEYSNDLGRGLDFGITLTQTRRISKSPLMQCARRY
jgi:hypothetical protein